MSFSSTSRGAFSIYLSILTALARLTFHVSEKLQKSREFIVHLSMYCESTALTMLYIFWDIFIKLNPSCCFSLSFSFSQLPQLSLLFVPLSCRLLHAQEPSHMPEQHLLPVSHNTCPITAVGDIKVCSEWERRGVTVLFPL